MMKHREVNVEMIKKRDMMHMIVHSKSQMLKLKTEHMERLIISGEEGGKEFIVVAVYSGPSFQFVVWDNVDVMSDHRPFVAELFSIGLQIMEYDLPEYYRNSLDLVYQEWLLISHGRKQATHSRN
jgi:hypothetical protein